MTRLQILLLGAAVLVGLMPGTAPAEDTVWLTSDSGSGRIRITGQVLDYTGRQIRIELAGGRQQDYPSAQVRAVETTYGPLQVEAQAALDRQQFQPALQGFRKAMDAESRPWVRRQILAKLVVCYSALGQVQVAAETFLVLVRSDPDTPDFGCIPLAWRPRDSMAALEQPARQWMARADLPAGVLLGASYLLTGSQRTAATGQLQQLTLSTDPKIALLAQAQLWRVSLMNVTPAQVQQWQSVIEKLPEGLRAGPYFLVGQAQVRLQQWDDAATSLMRVPILYDRQRSLAGAALFEAAGCLEQQNHRPEAIGLYREVVEKYPETDSASLARDRLQEMRKM